MENQADERDGEGLFGPQEQWSERMSSIRSLVEDLGTDLGPDEDWMPTVIVDVGKMPADMPGGEPVPPERVGKPGTLIIGLAGDFMKNDETKDWTASMMSLLALKTRATGMTFINVVWMLALKTVDMDLPKGTEATDEEYEKAAYNAARKVPPPSKHPERQEKLMLLSVQYGGPDDGTKLGFASIRRQRDLPPELRGWELYNGDDGAGSRFMGRFPDAIRAGLRASWEVTAAEAQGGA